ncbi:MAG TPA: NADH-quinone oxidoreductase subunit NuoG [Xanthomonadaceae bacterium]|nr:NADH-quinone oxidoreductase subunit NuoG [Xanthomonadaceae bacterium]
MSTATPTRTASEQVTIEIDGTAMTAPKGSMVIQAADRAGIQIPRFCYHEKLSIAANCRMCLVDIEKSPKPMPACATPVMEGMKVYTRSKRALDAQRNVMEFLLINHPLDCPICDQGGECELQDLSMGYGRSVSRFSERKRVVPDEDLGPLVSTDMTRCIQCTRCVRVMAEVAGTCELGGMGRGEDLQIGTYVGRPLMSELSGNVIDVCPVGALTNKVFRFRARPWELVSRDSIGCHDALGGNLHLHVRRNEVLRAVPRANEAVNECWASDRDRYSHQGLYASDRVLAPMVRDGQQWREATWEDAIGRCAELLDRHRGDALGVLVHPATSCEEGRLLADLSAGLECGNIDHRLRVLDFADAPVSEPFEMPLAAIEQADAIVLVGCDPRHEAPLLAHRIRKAWKSGAAIFAINPVDFPLELELTGAHIGTPGEMVDTLMAAARAASQDTRESAPQGMASAMAGADTDERLAHMVATLRQAGNAMVLVGDLANQAAEASWLRAGARYLARATGARLNVMPAGANAIGLAANGVLPAARNTSEMLGEPRQAYLLYGCEPPFDFADGAGVLAALSAARSVIACTAFADGRLKELAHVILPIAPMPETDATVVNCDGLVQTVAPATRPRGAARQGWRVLRALGGALELDGFDFMQIDAVRERMATAGAVTGSGLCGRTAAPAGTLARIATIPVYRGDAVLRRAAALNAHPLTAGARAVMHPDDARDNGLADGSMARFGNGRGTATLPVVLDARVARGAVHIESCYEATAPLGCGALTVEAAG